MYTVKPQVIKYADNIAQNQYGLTFLTLMKNAAMQIFRTVSTLLSFEKNIVILCGKGNNAGDGYELARILLKEFYNVGVINVFSSEPSSKEAKVCFNEYKKCGGLFIDSDSIFSHIETADVIIDAIFGVGFSGVIDSDSLCAKIIGASNQNKNALKISVDCPSGINCADGTADKNTFKADITATLALYKTGLFTYPAKDFCGDILLCDIGFPRSLTDALEYDCFLPDDNYIKSIIPKRQSNSHKGTFGRLMMFCANKYMTGCALLASNAALRSGVGLVNIVRDKKTLSVLQSHLTEPIFTPVCTNKSACRKKIVEISNNSDAVLIGCGLGKNKNDIKTVHALIKNSTSKLIIDADGINALIENINILKEAHSIPIITPHPAEFARLIGCNVSQVQNNRLNLARKFAKDYSCIVVLKGAATIIASPDGKTAINTTGNPGLSKGGSGDVLAGLCASFVCQGLDLFDACVASVYLHAKAADSLKEQISEYGFLPSDLPYQIAKLLP